MKKMFPDFEKITDEDIRIRIQVMPYANITHCQNFQSSLTEFQNFPSKSLKKLLKIEPRKPTVELQGQ